MFCENEDTVINKIEEQARLNKTYTIYNGLLYHYANYDTLWKILASDSFFARNIRFSNDSNEYMTGKSAIKRFVENSDYFEEGNKRAIFLQEIQNNPMMYFMVCFCEDGDLLSQWRGYAKNGVSIGLDFVGGYRRQNHIKKHVEYFSVLNNKECQDADEKNKGNFDCKYYLNEEDSGTVFVQMPYKVQYISKNDAKTANDILSQLYNSLDYEDCSDGAEKLIKCIPFLKDKSFEEEKEHRLIFDMEYLGESKAYSDYVCSKKVEYLESDSIKKPYINVEFGMPKDKLSNVTDICIGGDISDIESILNNTELKESINIFVDAKKKGIYIGQGKNQEEIVMEIEKYLETPKVSVELRKKIKIWCEGHLPIREIVVGPSNKQQDIEESLEFYKKTVYWLKYIEIKKSKIPLRD